MTLTLDLPPGVEDRLRRRAEAEGKDIQAFVLEAVEQKLEGEVVARNVTPEQRAARWDAWVAGMRKRVGELPIGHQLDDSRESIYREREDAQL